MSQMDKQERKALVKRWKAVERADLVASMPMTPQQLHQLLDFLDTSLKSCDHTTKLTAIFLVVEKLDSENVLPWLAEHGGFCDCEVLANLADLDEMLQAAPPAPRVTRQVKDNRLPRSLQTVTGWDFTKLPAPWRIANLYTPHEPLQLQLGKKGGCTLQVCERPLPPGDRSSDDYWLGLWHARTELPRTDSLRVTREALGLPENFESTIVRSPAWMPVYCWIIPKTDSWYLEVRTELNRCDGDLPQISSLIARLANG